METSQGPAAVDTNSAEASRGGCLTAWLVLMIIANTGSALVYLLRADPLVAHFPRLSGGGIWLLRAATLANIVLVVLIWNWRRVGVWGFTAVALLAFPLNLYIGVNPFMAALGLVGLVILAVLVRPKWALFK
jgi:hypothetical protein